MDGLPHPYREGGRLPFSKEMKQATIRSKNVITNKRRLYINDAVILRWNELKTSNCLTDQQLLLHLVDAHSQFCPCVQVQPQVPDNGTQPPPLPEQVSVLLPPVSAPLQAVPAPVRASASQLPVPKQVSASLPTAPVRASASQLPAHENCNPWFKDLGSPPRLRTVSTPRKRDVPELPATIDVSFDTEQSMIGSPPSAISSGIHNLGITSPTHPSFIDNLPELNESNNTEETIENVEQILDKTGATLGDSCDPLIEDVLDISLPDMIEDEKLPGDEENEESLSQIQSKKCVVFVDRLEELVKAKEGTECQHKHCGRKLKYTSTMAGTSLVVRWKCDRGHSGSWSSQPKVKGLFAGNLQLAADILLSGNSFAKIAHLFSYLHLGCISPNLFHSVQKLYALPAIEKFWNTMQLNILSKLKKSQPKGIVVTGDARNDSPGFNAQYCTYTMMEAETGEIVAIEIIDKRQTTSSVAMEKMGFLKCFDSLQRLEVPITEIVTDQSGMISSLISNDRRFEGILHQWDVWHAARNLEKRLTKLGSTRKLALIRQWAPSIRNHFWYCSKICQGHPAIMKEIWIRVLHHVCDQHDWAVSENSTGRCAHPPLNEEEDRNKPWFDKESPAMDALRGVVLDRQFIKNMEYFKNFRHTGSLEVFHSHILMYCPKLHSFSYIGYKTRNLVAAIDYNAHVNRPDKVDEDGNSKLIQTYRKKSKSWGVRHVKTKKGYFYKDDLQAMIFQEKLNDPLPTKRSVPLHPDDPKRITPRLSRIPKPTQMPKHISRF